MPPVNDSANFKRQDCPLPSDDVTLTIAIIGAVTGTAASLSQVYSTLRDRPRLSLGVSTKESIRETSSITVNVFNTGTRATTVRDVGFFIAKQQFDVYRTAEDTEPYTRGEGAFGCSVAQGIFLDAGESKEFVATKQVLGLGVHADQPLRLYATDIRGHRVWGQAVPVVRLLFGPEPDLDQMPPETRQLFEPPDVPLLPGKAEIWWKIWTKRELRKPSTWRNPLECGK